MAGLLRRGHKPGSRVNRPSNIRYDRREKNLDGTPRRNCLLAAPPAFCREEWQTWLQAVRHVPSASECDGIAFAIETTNRLRHFGQQATVATIFCIEKGCRRGPNRVEFATSL